MDTTFDLMIRARRAVTGGGEIACSIGIRDGRIAAIGPLDNIAAIGPLDNAVTAESPASAHEAVGGPGVLDIDPGVVLLPGLVDTHVHVCEPGNTEWEGFASATMAAAAGGITTLVDMPLDSVPVTVSTSALDIKRRAAQGQCAIDVGFWGGVIPGNLDELGSLHDAGVLGFKCFLADSGSDDFPPVDDRQLTAALRVLRELPAPLLVHAESAEAAAAVPQARGRSYAGYLAAHPRGLENLAIAQVIEAARATGGQAHIVHLSSSDALPMIASARGDGVRLTAETCPHYLILTAEEIADGATAAKCSPPVREAANREMLWAGLNDQVLDLVVSDHSPCTAMMKELDSGDFALAWGGISSVQLSLPLVWTEARRRGFTLTDVASWMAERPARLAGLTGKGRIAVGCDADFCLFAPDEHFVVEPDRLHHRHPVTPYSGRTLSGVVRGTMLRGRFVTGERPQGRLLARATS
ncbi:MAG TPA: allantoinase AllB [Streptosporangiaceae bacterium]|nr:allantoinase AllB [Streptosporangiaceae bacterium]